MISPRYTELPGGGHSCADCHAAGRTHGVITGPERHDSWHRLADGWAPRWSAERPPVTARPGPPPLKGEGPGRVVLRRAKVGVKRLSG